MPFSTQDGINFDKAWSKVLIRLGIRPCTGVGSPVLGLEEKIETTAALVLYVDPVAGDDGNPGTQVAPFKSIAAACDKTPLSERHNVIIRLVAGTHTLTGDVILPGAVNTAYIYEAATGPRGLLIEGTEVTVITPATGVATGTFASNDGLFTLTCTAAGWTVNNLRGKLCRILSGAKVGQLYPVASNTADTVDLGAVVSAIGNATFDFVEPSTVVDINQKSFRNMAVYRAGIVFKNIKFVGTTSGSGIITSYARSPLINFVTCTADVYTLGTVYFGTITLVNSYCAVRSNGLVVEDGVTFTNAVLDGTSANGTGIFLSRSSSCVMSSTGSASILQGFKSTAIGYGAGIAARGSNIITSSGSSGGLWIRDCTSGIEVTKNLNLLAVNIGSSAVIFKISGCKDAILVSNQGQFRFNAERQLDATKYPIKVVLTGNTRDAVRLESSGNVLRFAGTSDISGNTGFGVNLSPTDCGSPGFNSVSVGASVTMGTNTAGDLTLDGAAATAIADLRLDADKTIVDAVRFNRMVAD